jgi:hypothetical protein
MSQQQQQPTPIGDPPAKQYAVIPVPGPVPFWYAAQFYRRQNEIRDRIRQSLAQAPQGGATREVLAALAACSDDRELDQALADLIAAEQVIQLGSGPTGRYLWIAPPQKGGAK